MCIHVIEKFRFGNVILCEKLYLTVINESPINICHFENATSMKTRKASSGKRLFYMLASQ